jgi:energy-coupling factor transporter ATP-binding protein EcfA2
VNETALEQLVDRLDHDSEVARASVDAILAAADGPAALDAHLGGGAAPARRDGAIAKRIAEPARVYLEQIEVENFRGVGPPARLQVAPGPGLTLVVGRNGSGKSTFAEGLELLLTGTNLRWADKTKVWREGWRNLHGTGPTRIAARFRVDGERAPLEIRRTWAPDATLEGGDPIAVSGPRDSWKALAWDQALEQFRPLLSYSELGAMFSTRAAALYDALSAVLGLGEFDELVATLRQARLERQKTGKVEKDKREQVRELAQRSGDPRAADLDALLTRRTVDLQQAQQLAVSDTASGAGQARLAALAALGVPEPAEIEQAFGRLAQSAARVHELEQTEIERLDALAQLLADALGYHARHGQDQTCPVCGAPDRLDPGWSIRAQSEVQELERRSADLRAAREADKAALRAIADLFGPEIPVTLRGGAEAGIDVAAAQAAWDLWADVLAGGTPRAAVAEELSAALRATADEAHAEQRRRDLDWQPVRTAAADWLATARDAIRDKTAVATLKAAEAWMAACTAALRQERLAPIVHAAQENWKQLRHESNVALGDIALRKAGMQRYAVFDVNVDGAASSAFGVMSQGELSALPSASFCRARRSPRPRSASWSLTTRCSPWTPRRSTASPAFSHTLRGSAR